MSLRSLDSWLFKIWFFWFDSLTFNPNVAPARSKTSTFNSISFNIFLEIIGFLNKTYFYYFYLKEGCDM